MLGFWKWLAMIGASAAAVLGALAYGFFKGNEAGKNESAAAAAKATNEAVTTATQAEAKVDAMPEGGSMEDLRNNWSR